MVRLLQEEDNDVGFVEAMSPTRPQLLHTREDQKPLTLVEQEALTTTAEFERLSNLYQILSAPRLRRIYDEEGVEGLAAKSPMLHKGLLDPATVLILARGQEVSEEPPRKSLLLRRFPRTPGFKKYRSKNGIRQVLDRLTDVFRVFSFMRPEDLDKRKNTVYEMLPEVGVFGRTNSGKSSLLKHFLSHASPMIKKNRLMTVARRPGKTRNIDMYCVNRRFTFADMPGWSSLTNDGWRERAMKEVWDEKSKPLVDKYLATTPQMRAAIYVHDIAKDPTVEDKENVKRLLAAGIPTLLVFTKDDKVDSEEHRLSRVKFIRRGLRWPKKWPHTHYCARRGGYGKLFKNMFGTMVLGLLSTEAREDAQHVLENELPSIFHDYRDKYVPRKRGPRNEKLPKLRRWRTYPDEDKVYTDEHLEIEERAIEREEKKRMREEMEAQGIERTVEDDIYEEVGSAALSPKQRRDRWRQMLSSAKV